MPTSTLIINPDPVPKPNALRRLLASSGRHVFTRQALLDLLKNAGYKENAIAATITAGPLSEWRIPSTRRPLSLYAKKDVPLELVACSVHQSAYLSHGTAATLHGLANRADQLYLNIEQRLSSPSNPSLIQARIDSAFARRARQTSNTLKVGSRLITLINGKNTEHCGVIDFEIRDKKKRYIVKTTTIERTLLDIATRPIYAGGVHCVMEAYKLASSAVSIPRLCETITNVGHVYPYHQAVGFYLSQTASFTEKELSPLRDFPMEYDFYLDNAMPQAEYSQEWKIYFPKTLLKK